MKKALAMFAVVLALGMTAFDADAAKRLGGGKSTGMQRSNVTAPGNTPGQAGSPGQAAPAVGAPAAGMAGAAAAAPKRSWMGPIAGLAAGLGLAALASHFGFGEGLANMLMIGLVIMAVLAVVGMIMRKRAAGQGPALAGAGTGGAARGASPLFGQQPQQAAYRTNEAEPASTGGSMIGSRVGGGMAGATAQAAALPADFDTAAFERNAKAQFMGLQAANDTRDINGLREYLSPEMFDIVSAEIAARGDTPQQTEVFGLGAQVLALATEGSRYVASVRFTGSVRDERGAAPEELDEIWHLTKPVAGNGGWVIAGIQQAGTPS
jgi:predicted lipid-binding transport protein (Tim44 family)